MVTLRTSSTALLGKLGPLVGVAVIGCFLVLIGCASTQPTVRDSGQNFVTLSNGERRTILRRVAPDYPVALRKRGTSEVVIVRFVVEPDGHIGMATAVQSANEALSRLAEAAVKQWVLAPASDGKPAEFQIPLTFIAH